MLLTTHYLDEAEQLADRVAVLREGEIVALGTPRELTARVGPTEIRYRAERSRGRRRDRRADDDVLHELTGEALAAGARARGAPGAPAVTRGHLPLAHGGASE